MQQIPTMVGGDNLTRADNGCAFRGPTAKTAAYSVTAADTGSAFSNAGASGSVTFTLPTAKAGLWYAFFVSAAQAMVVLAAGGAKINGSGANGNIAVDNSQSLVGFMTVFSDGTNWYVHAHGTWTTT